MACVQIDVLQIDYGQPYHQSKRNQKAENGLCCDKGGGYAAFHFPSVRQVYHLFPYQDVDGQCSQQASQEWSDLSEKDDSQSEDDSY